MTFIWHEMNHKTHLLSENKFIFKTVVREMSAVMEILFTLSFETLFFRATNEKPEVCIKL